MNTIIQNLFSRVLAFRRKAKQVEVSEKILASIAQTATDAIIIADADSTIIFCNKKATDIFGYSWQEMINSNLSLLMPGKYREEHSKSIVHFMATGIGQSAGHTVEIEGIRKDGLVFPMELSLSFWQQEGVFFTAIIRDITKRKRTEQENQTKNLQLQQANEELLRIQEVLKETNSRLEKRVEERTAALAESEHELRLITDALPVLISYVDKDERYRFANRAYEWWFKLDRKAILGKSLREIAGEQAYEKVREKIAQALGGRSVSFEREMNYQRVESRHVFFHFIPRWEEEKVVGFYLLASDITERKKAEQEARAASDRFGLLLESIPHLAWTSPAGELSINFFNKRWYEYTGLTQEQSIGTGWQQVLHPDDLPLAVERRTIGRRDGVAYEVENRYRHQEGGYRWHLSRIVPIKDEKNTIVLWVGTATDIHDQKILEQAIQRTSEELAASNRELTEANQAVLESNEKLKVSNEQLLIINTDLDNFIYTASHDLKSPIANIEGLTIALTKKLTVKFTLDDEQNKILSMLAASVDRLKSTIANLTEIAKVQKEAQEEELVSIENIVEEVYQDLGMLISNTGVAIHKHLLVKQIKFSRKNLRSIVLNLLSNAIKYHSQQRKPIVEISTKAEAKYIIIEVKDNGIGIAPHNLQKLFTMFKRFHTHVEGTGIGLYIIKRIVENAGGKITVESQVEEGTTFHIYLPVPAGGENHSLPAGVS
jgi:PAS domain S-box-containing protein